ncbi:MAG: hypothetical protein ACFFBE_03330 [Promethearchaeota archaeon]
MAVGKKKITPMLKEFPKYKILDEIEEKVKKEAYFFISLESDSDPIQMKRNIKRWKQTISYYLLHPEKFKFGLRDL